MRRPRQDTKEQKRLAKKVFDLCRSNSGDYVEQELLQNFKQDVKELMAAQDSLNESLSAEVAARLKEETQSRIEGDQAMGRNFGIEVKRLETEMSNACAELKKEMQTLTESVEGQANSRASGVGLTARLFDEESCHTSEASAGCFWMRQWQKAFPNIRPSRKQPR